MSFDLRLIITPLISQTFLTIPAVRHVIIGGIVNILHILHSYSSIKNNPLIFVVLTGRNCYLGNKIIPAGKAVQVDDHTTCKCPDRFGFGMTAQRAICAVKVDHVTAKIVN